MVRHVTAPVQIRRHERRITEQPAPDDVVDTPVGEQKTVRGLVSEAGEPGELRSHEHEGGKPSERTVDPNRTGDDGNRAEHERCDRPSVQQIGDAAELGAQFGNQLAVGEETLGGKHIRKLGRGGDHRERHRAELLHFLYT